MSVELLEPSPIEQYVDEEGRLTIEGVKLLQRLVEALRDHESRIETLEP